MPIADDWDFNYAAKVISHIDGVITYGSGTGTLPSVGDMIQGATSGAIGKVLAAPGTVASGTFTLTNVLGVFQSGEQLDTLSSVDFDNVGNGGFKIGDTIVDQVTGSIDVKFIEYNIDGIAGHGTIYGDNFTAFTNDSQLDISGGQTAVADADGTGTDNDTAFDATTSTALVPPGTANTNNSVIIHYDGGTLAIPEDAHITDATSTAEGYAQRVYGAIVTGSIRVVDSDTTGGSWTDNNTLRILDVEFYDSLVAGKVFSVGDIVQGGTSGYKARVIAVIDDGDNTGKLILAGNTGTPWTDTEDIDVLQSDDTYVTYANVESGQNSYLDAATINIPAGVRSVQRPDQGGIYAVNSLNVVRSANSLYSYAMDLFDELAQLDDDPALDGNVRDQLYTILYNYVVPDLSFRFIEKGSFRDTANNNVFTNVQTTGAIADIGNWGFFYDSTNPTPQPDMYIEQDGVVKNSWWLEGNLDVVLKTKTSTDPAYINPAVESLGQNIDNGAFTVHLRPYRRTYDSNEVTQVGGIAVVAVGNARDLNNTTAQYSATQSGGSGTFVLGEEATTTGGKRVVIMNAATGGTGNITWALKGDTNLVGTDAITGSVSGATSTINVVSSLVAGYDTNIRVMVVQRRFTGGTTANGPFVLGELITQATSGATGYFMEDDGGTIYIEEQSGTFTGTNQLTGGVSGATNTPTATTAWGDWEGSSEGVPKDIGGGVGDIDYAIVVSADITNADPRPLSEVYEWWKFITRRESDYQVNKPSLLFSDYWLGKVYRRPYDSFAEVRGASPFGLKAGSLVIGAQGVFIEKATLDSGDIRNIQLIGNNGTTYNPPNLQVLQVTNLFAGVRVAVYRSTGSGNADILRGEYQVGTVSGANNGTGDSQVLVQAGTRSVSPLAQDVPDTGVLRILDPADSGNYLRYPYISVDRTTNIFTLSGTLSADLVQGDDVHVALIEEEATGTSVNNTIQYVSDIPLFVRARIKGKKPFRTTATFGSTGASIGAVLNTDEVVNLP